MDTHRIISIALGLIFFMEGLSALIRKGNDSLALSFKRNNYTEESVLKFIKIHGITSTVCGAFIILAPFVLNYIGSVPVLIICGALILLDLIAVFTVPKKK